MIYKKRTLQIVQVHSEEKKIHSHITYFSFLFNCELFCCYVFVKDFPSYVVLCHILGGWNHYKSFVAIVHYYKGSRVFMGVSVLLLLFQD